MLSLNPLEEYLKEDDTGNPARELLEKPARMQQEPTIALPMNKSHGRAGQSWKKAWKQVCSKAMNEPKTVGEGVKPCSYLI